MKDIKSKTRESRAEDPYYLWHEQKAKPSHLSVPLVSPWVRCHFWHFDQLGQLHTRDLLPLRPQLSISAWSSSYCPAPPHHRFHHGLNSNQFLMFCLVKVFSHLVNPYMSNMCTCTLLNSPAILIATPFLISPVISLRVPPMYHLTFICYPFPKRLAMSLTCSHISVLQAAWGTKCLGTLWFEDRGYSWRVSRCSKHVSANEAGGRGGRYSPLWCSLLPAGFEKGQQ